CMEYIAGTTLRAWLGERPRSWREIARVFVAAGRGLAYVHAAGLVHRDFKPDNVMIGRDGRVVVTDFGLAHVARGARGLLGTPAYMPPEQCRGEAVDARADQYAFCAALREALGERAKKLGRAIARGLERFAGDRFASMDELLAAIEGRLRSRRSLARVGIVAAAVALAALSVPRSRDIVTRVIDRPVVERVVEARPALPAGQRGRETPGEEVRARVERASLVAAAPPRSAPSSARSRAFDPIANAVTRVHAPAQSPPPRPTLAAFELPGGFTPVPSCD